MKRQDKNDQDQQMDSFEREKIQNDPDFHPLFNDPLQEEEELINKLANRTYFVVVSYDIPDDKKRKKLAKLILGYGERVQYSVFECHLTEKKIDKMTTEILRLINEEEDLIRIYRIAGTPKVTVFGKVPLTEDEAFLVI